MQSFTRPHGWATPPRGGGRMVLSTLLYVMGEFLLMRRSNHPLASAVKWLSAVACGLMVFAYAPKVASAVIMGNVWTTGYAGGGFTAVTTSLRPAELRVESDWSS